MFIYVADKVVTTLLKRIWACVIQKEIVKRNPASILASYPRSVYRGASRSQLHNPRRHSFLGPQSFMINRRSLPKTRAFNVIMSFIHVPHCNNYYSIYNFCISLSCQDRICIRVPARCAVAFSHSWWSAESIVLYSICIELCLAL